MISAVISIIFGVLSLFTAVPVVLPVFGLALGVNAILKEKKKANKRKNVLIIAIIGLIANGFVTLMFILKIFLK